jgi:hypothetical protein
MLALGSKHSDISWVSGFRRASRNGIAAQVGGDIDFAARRAVILEEHVDALVEAHQRQRNRVVARRENDRVVALRVGELLDCQRDRVLVAEPLGLVDRAGAPLAMVAAVEGHQVLVEQGKLGLRLGGHR